MPGDIIRADYDELARIAQEFDLEGCQIDQLILRLQRCVDELEHGGWIGRGANAFYNEMHNDVFPGLHRLADALIASSDAVTRISDIIREAEEEAASLFGRTS